MAKFSFPGGSAEEDGLPEEEGTDVSALGSRSRRSGGLRRILIILGIGVILGGGWYLAQPLFFAPQPSPPTPVRPRVTPPPIPPAAAPAPVAPIKEAAPTPIAPTKQPVKPAAKPEPAPPSEKAPPAGPPAAAKSESAKVATPEKATSPAKAGAKQAKKRVAKPAPAAVARYSLQVGAMVLEENAETLKRKLSASGFPAVIRKGNAPVKKQVVTVGEPTGKAQAEELSRRLNVDGFPSQLLAVGGKYTPQIGAFFNLDEAIDLARELQKKNYPPKITSKPATTVVYQVRHGKFNSRAAAVRRGEELKKKGFNFLVVRE